MLVTVDDSGVLIPQCVVHDVRHVRFVPHIDLQTGGNTGFTHKLQLSSILLLGIDDQKFHGLGELDMEGTIDGDVDTEEEIDDEIDGDTDTDGDTETPIDGDTE